MEEARRIASDAELRDIGLAGDGYVADPFNCWWHVASCSRIPGMTVGEPKWFAPTRAALDAYLDRRMAQYPTAKPIMPCETCAGGSRSGSPRATAGVGADPQIRPPDIRCSDGRFDVWADECVRNESKASSSAGGLRRLIAGELRTFPEAEGRILHAIYAGERRSGTDVENLLFNNVDQALELFRRPARAGVRFEDLGLVVPAAPDGTTRRNFYSYRLTAEDEPFETARAGELICRVPEVVVPEGPARLAARVWLAVRRARPGVGAGASLEHGEFMLKIGVRGLDPGTTVKALVDGATAAMQRDEPDRIGQAIARLSELLGVDDGALLDLATAPDAPLGTRSRSRPNSKECLFTLDGATQVRVTPDDDRCIAAEVLAQGDDGPARLTVDVYSATRC